MPLSDFDFDSVQFAKNTGVDDPLKTFLHLLADYNEKINLVSRQMIPQSLIQLMNETILMDDYISKDCHTIVDAGSGNGLLGIPIAIMNKSQKIILVETIRKKAEFLNFIKSNMQLSNLEVYNGRVESYFQNRDKKNKEKISLISRGFPNIALLFSYVKSKAAKEAVLITSENKIKKNHNDLESLNKKIYNLPLRDSIKILRMEKTKSE